MIVSPNRVHHTGELKPESEEAKHVKLENVRFAYPAKEEVDVVKGVSIDVSKN